MKIGILPSSQRTSTGSGIGNHNERELMIDLTDRLIPKLRAAGHVVQAFYAATEVGSDGAQALVAWHPQICIDLHLDSAGGAPAALLCYQEQRSLAMGLKILSVYCQAMGIHDKGGMLRTPGVSGVAVIRIPEASGIPTALIECGDMDAPDGYNWVRPEHREKAAVCMAKAICSYAGGSIPQEVEVAIAQTLHDPAHPDVTGLLGGPRKGYLYLDIVNKDTKPIKVTLDGMGPDGGRKTISLPAIQPRSAPPALDFTYIDAGEKLGAPNWGNVHIVITADGLWAATATQQLI